MAARLGDEADAGTGDLVGVHLLGAVHALAVGDAGVVESAHNNCAYIALPRDVTLSNSLGKEGATLYICLNGHKLSSSNLEAPIINNLKNLVICDCVGTGEIGNRGTDDSPAVQAINIANDCNVYVYGGSIANNITNSNGAGVLLGDSASFYMYGGSVRKMKLLKTVWRYTSVYHLSLRCI